MSGAGYIVKMETKNTIEKRLKELENRILFLELKYKKEKEAKNKLLKQLKGE